MLDALKPDSAVVERSAVHEQTMPRKFINLGLMSSRLCERPSSIPNQITKEVDSVALDDYLHNWIEAVPKGRTLLKVHVEGAELAALRGAKRLIDKLSPDIFINLSHDEESLLEIVPYLKNNYGYELKLIAYSLFGEGLTLAASRMTND